MRTILVVDDEFGVADVLAAILEDADYRVVSASNGRQGLARLAEPPRPDAALIDLMMPVMDGGAMLRAMREDPAFRDLPVVMMSGLDEAAVRARAPDFAAFLRKPFRFEAVVETLARLLDGPGAADRG